VPLPQESKSKAPRPSLCAGAGAGTDTHSKTQSADQYCGRRAPEQDRHHGSDHTTTMGHTPDGEFRSRRTCRCRANRKARRRAVQSAPSPERGQMPTQRTNRPNRVAPAGTRARSSPPPTPKRPLHNNRAAPSTASSGQHTQATPQRRPAKTHEPHPNGDPPRRTSRTPTAIRQDARAAPQRRGDHTTTRLVNGCKPPGGHHNRRTDINRAAAQRTIRRDRTTDRSTDHDRNSVVLSEQGPRNGGNDEGLDTERWQCWNANGQSSSGLQGR